MSYASKVMIGMAVIGSALEAKPEAGSHMAFIVMGNHDHALKCAHFFQHFKRMPTNEEELEAPEVLVMLERTKNYFRSVIQQIFDEADRQDRLEQQAKQRELLEQLRDSNKPHEMGTVAEIAAKYGISKSEVRRRKADGTLHELKKAT